MPWTLEISLMVSKFNFQIGIGEVGSIIHEVNTPLAVLVTLQTNIETIRNLAAEARPPIEKRKRESG